MSAVVIVASYRRSGKTISLQVTIILTDVDVMRVIAGLYKGRSLRTVAGLSVRPTSDRLRETLFNILTGHIEGAQFLDICAGSGAVGIEALSRGAAHVTFIEASRRAVRVIYDNIEHCHIDEGTEVLYFDALTALKQLSNRGHRFDIVYFDPPYSSHVYLPVLESLGNKDLLAANGLVIVEHHSKLVLADVIGVLRRYREVRQGETSLSFYHNL
ncbi:MAG: 16S rRNA (guanine(966)-N(2))-methyltransferase RsmD [Acidobacteriota bacterium]